MNRAESSWVSPSSRGGQVGASKAGWDRVCLGSFARCFGMHEQLLGAAPHGPADKTCSKYEFYKVECIRLTNFNRIGYIASVFVGFYRSSRDLFL